MLDTKPKITGIGILKFMLCWHLSTSKPTVILSSYGVSYILKGFVFEECLSFIKSSTQFSAKKCFTRTLKEFQIISKCFALCFYQHWFYTSANKELKLPFNDLFPSSVYVYILGNAIKWRWWEKRDLFLHPFVPVKHKFKHAFEAYFCNIYHNVSKF